MVQTSGMQTSFRPVQIFCTPEVGTHISVIKKNLANSCWGISLLKMLFMPIESPDRVSKVGIFGPKLGLHGLAQVWTPLPPDEEASAPKTLCNFKSNAIVLLYGYCSGVDSELTQLS